MQIELKIDPSCSEPKIIVETNQLTDEVNALLKKLSAETPQTIAGFRGNQAELLEQPTLIRVYSAAGKVYAATERGEYLLRLRLYELEERLDPTAFVRISNSEIVNLKQVKSFDLSLSGTICVRLSDHTVTYVSRRYVSKIKHALEL